MLSTREEPSWVEGDFSTGALPARPGRGDRHGRLHPDGVGLLIALALLVRVGLERASCARWQMAAELLVEHLEGRHARHVRRDPGPYTPLVVTLALFIGTANLLGLAPGMRSPTADFSTTAALAVLVFFAVPFYGVRARGLRGYLRHYLEPTPVLLPLEIITEFSRTLALAVRLFGNVMSEELVIAVLLSIAGPAGAGADHDAGGPDRGGAGVHLRRPDGRFT